MCGIIGYVGTGDASKVLLEGLELLEYRGYDSAGAAFCHGQDVHIYKCPGKVSDLKTLVPEEESSSHAGIGHTRWATHGSVSFKNAHPHKAGRITLVHNGIIENYKELIREYDLEERRLSSGDSEVAALLLDDFYEGDPFEAIRKLLSVIQGTYALVILFEDREGEIYAVRKVSPIVYTHTDDASYLASDPLALSLYSREYGVLPEGAVLCMKKDGILLQDLNGNDVKEDIVVMDETRGKLDKGEASSYMEKEIAEQPDIIERLLDKRIRDSLPDLSDSGLNEDILRDIPEIGIIACGTSYHASLVAKMMIEKHAKVRCNVYLASEFLYSDPILEEGGLLIGVSQSGETIDTLEALRYGKEKGQKTLAIINVKGSSLSRIADHCLYTEAGPEIAVASTKAYTAQLILLFLFAYALADAKKPERKEEWRRLTEDLKTIPDALRKVMEEKEAYRGLAEKLKDAHDLFMIGRSLDYLVLLEGALKLKEISYIHTEAYASGELKHGPIALIEDGTPVIAAVTQKDLLLKESSNIKEVRARGARAYVLIRSSLKDELIQKVERYPLPDLSDDLMVFPCVAALQLISCYCAIVRGCNVDKPRNLAKVVTVE